MSPLSGLQRALQPGKGGSGGGASPAEAWAARRLAADALARERCGRHSAGSAERSRRALGPKCPSGAVPSPAPAGPRGQGSRRAVGKSRRETQAVRGTCSPGDLGQSEPGRRFEAPGTWVRVNLGGGYPGLSTAAVWTSLRPLNPRVPGGQGRVRSGRLVLLGVSPTPSIPGLSRVQPQRRTRSRLS